MQITRDNSPESERSGWFRFGAFCGRLLLGLGGGTWGRQGFCVLLIALVALTSTASAQEGGATIGFSLHSVEEVDRVAAGFCVDEMVDVLMLDGRSEVVPPQSPLNDCAEHAALPLEWARCMFGEPPTVALQIDARISSHGYRLSIRYITGTGEALDNSTSVIGDLRDLLFRCRSRAVSLLGAMYGSESVRDDLIESRALLHAENQSARWSYGNEDRSRVWQRYPGDRVGDYRPRRTSYLTPSRSYYEPIGDARVGDYLPRHYRDGLGPTYLTAEEVPEDGEYDMQPYLEGYERTYAPGGGYYSAPYDMRPHFDGYYDRYGGSYFESH